MLLQEFRDTSKQKHWLETLLTKSGEKFRIQSLNTKTLVSDNREIFQQKNVSPVQVSTVWDSSPMIAARFSTTKTLKLIEEASVNWSYTMLLIKDKQRFSDTTFLKLKPVGTANKSREDAIDEMTPRRPARMETKFGELETENERSDWGETLFAG